LGATGAGKEMIARAIHELSPRRGKPFKAINCANIREALAGSTLFGYVKGAFTGAYQDQLSLFEEAEGGTLFLDEIGELPLEQQAQLLRALQEMVICRLGSHKERRINVRIIAATNRDLTEAIAQGRFRLDLYHRLSTSTIHLPTLYQRPEDIPALALHFASLAQKRLDLDSKLVASFCAHAWTGNVRELENWIEEYLTLGFSKRPLPPPNSAGNPLVPLLPAHPPNLDSEPAPRAEAAPAQASTASAKLESGPRSQGLAPRSQPPPHPLSSQEKKLLSEFLKRWRELGLDGAHLTVQEIKDQFKEPPGKSARILQKLFKASTISIGMTLKRLSGHVIDGERLSSAHDEGLGCHRWFILRG